MPRGRQLPFRVEGVSAGGSRGAFRLPCVELKIEFAERPGAHHLDKEAYWMASSSVASAKQLRTLLSKMLLSS